MAELLVVKLKHVVRFREFPFGIKSDPSIQESMAEVSWEHQEDVLHYLRSGYILGVSMGADLPDWFDPGEKANPLIHDRFEGGTTPMTDGTWFWYAGLIYFIEKYNVRVPPEFVEHARSRHWTVDQALIGPYDYDFLTYD